MQTDNIASDALAVTIDLFFALSACEHLFSMITMNNFLALSGLSLMPYAVALPTVATTPMATPATTFSRIVATSSPTVSSAPSVVSIPTSISSPGPFTGTPTVIGALNATSTGTGISSLPPPAAATTYISNGNLHDAAPAPFEPAGGVGTNGTIPVYNARSDYDYQSLALQLYQEYLALDTLRYGLSNFSLKDFNDAGLNASDRYLIEWMADQQLGHVTMLTNILGTSAPKMCTYNYPFTTVYEFIDFCQVVTSVGESGVYGYVNHLNSRDAAQLLTQATAIKARQQMIFRQLQGLFPMPVWFEAAIPQSWQWSLLAPCISSCPANQTRLAWENFPALRVVNQPNPMLHVGSLAWNETTVAGLDVLNSTNVSNSTSCVNGTMSGVSCSPAISHNRSVPLSFPGRLVYFEWDSPGKAVGPNNSYVTSNLATSPKYVAWVSQLNVTYSNLTVTYNTTASNSTFGGFTTQPDVFTYSSDPAINGTMFVAITDDDVHVTPFNISMINPHMVAGPAVYQSG